VSGLVELTTRTPAQTRAIGRALGRLLEAHDVLALAGPLGAGKTQLVKGVASGLRVGRQEPVVSPTFVLVREYHGRLRFYHVDAYRLSDPRELAALGFEEMLADPAAAVAVEWADRVRALLPASAWWIVLDHVDLPGQRADTDSRLRRVRLELPDARRAGVLRQALARIPGLGIDSSGSSPQTFTE
jgi:tRNA threonylcarbamoyladenosine biosynthesis protein TsaE